MVETCGLFPLHFLFSAMTRALLVLLLVDVGLPCGLTFTYADTNSPADTDSYADTEF